MPTFSTFVHTTRRDLLVVAVILFAALSATGIAHAAPESTFEPAFAHFLAASDGDASAVDSAADAFDALYKAEPSNPVLMAYDGASTAMRAKTSLMPWKKMGYAEDGLALIDKALASLTLAHDAPIQHRTPGSLEVSFVAANTFLAVPSFMNRSARGTKLLADVLASPLLPQAPLAFQGTVWMRAAALATQEHRTADAQQLLNEVVERNAPQADKARALLKAAP